MKPLSLPVAVALVLLLELVLTPPCLGAEDQLFLLRNAPTTRPKPDDLTRETGTAQYKPLFGAGDTAGHRLRGVVRYGELTVEAKGKSAVVSYPDEEQIYFILEGVGTLLYGEERVLVQPDDFMYLPAGVKHGILNHSVQPIRLVVMGFSIPPGTKVEPAPDLQLANAGEVEWLVLGSHGPTTQYKLLMGTTESTRDRLASAHQMVSLYLMKFLPTGTNRPHRHPKQEEIYYLLRGYGHMVGGLDRWGNGQRHPSQAGDAFYFAPGTEVGFFSGGKEGEEHALILAVRSNDPTFSKNE
jgi:mannose-6-phosphate isomerase-like protein (cupin superfamily)